mgnify:CR=1 FL=1
MQDTTREQREVRSMKKLMILGGSKYAVPVIETAHRLGIYVITCDYLPDNTAHKYSDEYCNVSIIDKEAVLEAAQNQKIDGIVSFACDPGVVTAAYVAEQMGLPFQCSYEAAVILQDKGLFRQFLTDHAFNAPHARRYTDLQQPLKDIDFFTWPVIVKPVDSAGSKGVTRVDDPDLLAAAIETAVAEAHNAAFIIEDFLTFEGCHSSADLFTVGGKLEFVTYSDHWFDQEADNPYTPAMNVWPSSMKLQHQQYLTRETQRLMDLLGMRNGIYNIETCVGSNGKPYIMEVSPRGGGNKIAEIQELAFNVKLIENEVRQAVQMPLLEMEQRECDGYWCEIIIHARPGQSGVLKSVAWDPDIERKYVKVIDISAKPGDVIQPFTGANMALGHLFLRFDSREELNDVMSRQEEWLHIEIQK